MKIWLIGGTSESVLIAKLLLKKEFFVVATVATPGAINLYDHHPNLKVVAGKISVTQMSSFLAQHNIKIIVDASHPFAVNVSQGAVTNSQLYHIPYLRYDRPGVSSPQKNIIKFSSFESLLESQYLNGKKVLLTIGCQPLHFFQDYHQQINLFTRVLPYPQSLEKAYQAGFKCDRIIALRPPINYHLEKAICQNWHIETIVTKAGGKAGGQNVKQQLAQELNISLALISRPTLEYPQATNNFEEILKFCQQHQKK